MNQKRTTVKNIIKALDYDMCIITDVKLHYKNSKKIENIVPTQYLTYLKNLQKSNIFGEFIDFDFKYICKGNIVDNDNMIISCGYKNYYSPYYITACFKLNKNICNSLQLLSYVLLEDTFD